MLDNFTALHGLCLFLLFVLAVAGVWISRLRRRRAYLAGRVKELKKQNAILARPMEPIGGFRLAEAEVIPLKAETFIYNIGQKREDAIQAALPVLAKELFMSAVNLRGIVLTVLQNGEANRSGWTVRATLQVFPAAEDAEDADAPNDGTGK